jgi:hypothetical protein
MRAVTTGDPTRSARGASGFSTVHACSGLVTQSRSARRYEAITLSSHRSCDAVGVGFPNSKSPNEPARHTASARVRTSSFKKICLTCDFTVSGEIPRARATRLLERPWLIIARTSRSRAVSGSLTRLQPVPQSPMVSSRFSAVSESETRPALCGPMPDAAC